MKRGDVVIVPFPFQVLVRPGHLTVSHCRLALPGRLAGHLATEYENAGPVHQRAAKLEYLPLATTAMRLAAQ